MIFRLSHRSGAVIHNLIHTAKEHSNVLPAYWSQAGKDLLFRIIYDDDKQQQVFPPADLFLDQDGWRRKCEAVCPMATLLVMTHGEDFGMVPLTDKFNSRGGNYTGAYFSIENGVGDTALEIRALRPLKKGEQIYTDYRDYGAIGLPELLRDYGFIETYPQRWIFHRQRVTFDVTKENSNKFEVEWRDENKCIRNSTKTNPDCFFVAEFFRNQLDRLEQTVHALIDAAPTQNNAPSAYELHIIRQFYTALTNALRLGLKNIDTTSIATSAEAADEL